MNYDLYMFDGVFWNEELEPLCPVHKLEMDEYTYDEEGGIGSYKYDHLRCEECKKDYKIPRDLSAEQVFIGRKLKALKFKDAKILNLDDQAIPIAETKIPKDNKYFVTAILTDSKVGKRLIIYAGERGKKEKTQVFVEPNIRRLSFDHKDLHPADVFLSVEAMFDDGTKGQIRKTKKKPKK